MLMCYTAETSVLATKRSFAGMRCHEVTFHEVFVASYNTLIVLPPLVEQTSAILLLSYIVPFQSIIFAVIVEFFTIITVTIFLYRFFFFFIYLFSPIKKTNSIFFLFSSCKNIRVMFK